MRVLVITQKVDSNDSVLGFFHRWISDFAKQFERVTVICLEKGVYDLPQNVTVLSLGKEKKRSRLGYVWNFYTYIWRERHNYDVVFVHMNQEYVLLGWKVWKLLGKKIFLWRNHKKGNCFTDLAVALSDRTFCTSNGSYTARFKKTTIMPVGVDATVFRNLSEDVSDLRVENEIKSGVKKIPRSILFLGRISPVKHVDVLVKALGILHAGGHEFIANFYGGPTPVDHEYFEKIKSDATELVSAGKVVFKSEVPNSQTPVIYNQHEISVNLTDSGSFDKTIIEAMLCETMVLVSNESLRGFFGNQGERFIFEDRNAADLAAKLATLLSLSEDEKKKAQKKMRSLAQKHSLEHLVTKLVAFFNEQPKKIAILINNLGVGGAERLVINSIHELVRLGVHVDLITLATEPTKTLADQLIMPCERKHRIVYRGLFDIRSWVQLVSLLRTLNPDMIITQLWFANTIGRIAAQLAGIKKVISYEQNVYDSVKTKKMFFVDWCLQRITFKIVAVSEAVKKSLIRHRISGSKIDVIHNSVDISLFANTRPNSEIRKQYDIPTEAFLFVFIGRLIHQKAVDVLVEAFAKITHETSSDMHLCDSHLLIVGQGKERSVLEALVEKRGLSTRVTFAGVRNDIPELLATADCFVLPSRYEGLPLVLTEALAAGKAVVASDFEAVSEIITHRKNGLIVPRENVQVLAEAMKEIKNDTVVRSHLMSEAKKSSERFSVAHHADALLKYLDIV